MPQREILQKDWPPVPEKDAAEVSFVGGCENYIEQMEGQHSERQWQQDTQKFFTLGGSHWCNLGIKFRLKYHQTIGSWVCAASLHKPEIRKQKGFLLADGPGVGKTRTALLTVGLAMANVPVLIIVPKSCITSWKEEVDAFFSMENINEAQSHEDDEADLKMIRGRFVYIYDHEDSDELKIKKYVQENKVVVMSHSRFRIIMTRHKKNNLSQTKKWISVLGLFKLIVVDEAHQVSNCTSS